VPTLQSLAALVISAALVNSAIVHAQPAPAVRAVPVQVWPDAQFEQWVFQQDRTAEQARRRFESSLPLHIDEIDRVCQVTPDQKKKLYLMGRGDIKRLFDRYENVKHQFNLHNNDINRLNEIQQQITPLRFALQGGLFDEHSLLAKSIRHTLTDEQYARYDATARDRRAYRHRAQIELAVRILEESVPLRDAQRRELIALLTKETKPIRTTYGYDIYVMMDRLGRIPDEKIKSLFSNPQWKVLERVVNQYKGIVPNLRRNGMLLDEDDDAEAPPG
jgi:hypothetical protein